MGATSSVASPKSAPGSAKSLDKIAKTDKAIDKLFGAIDKNKDGDVTIIEMYEYLNEHSDEFGFGLSIAEMKKIILEFDLNGDGKMCRTEFGVCMAALKYANSKEGRAEAKKRAQQLKKAFGYFDKESTKALTLDNLTAIFWDPAGRVAYTEEEARVVLSKYDADGDGALSYAEFVAWWTEVPSAVYDPKAMEELHEEQLRQEEEMKAAAIEEAISNERLAARVAPTSIEQEFWQKQEELTVWKIPFTRDISRMPFLPPGVTGLQCAVERSRQQGRTPLLIDNSENAVADALFRKLPRCVVLEASLMFSDERWQKRTHKQVMHDTRLLLVEAMRNGKVLYLRLAEVVTDFANGNFSGPDWFPLDVFDQTAVADLQRFTGPDGLSLWEADSPFAKVLRHTDLDRGNEFRLAPGFAVLVCTLLPRAQYKELLELSIALPRCQAIEVTTKPLLRHPA